jgi:hypothetical protein
LLLLFLLVVAAPVSGGARYDVTDGLPATYDGSEDGMHFGLLVNHEKVQRVLGVICENAPGPSLSATGRRQDEL